MTELVITVFGTPAPQGSKDFFRGRPVESSKLVKPWRADVASAVLGQRANRRWAGPVGIDATFYLARPAAHFGTGRNSAALRGDAPDFPIARGRGDVDKYARGLLDALQLAGVFDDDGQVVRLAARKLYADGVRPGAVVCVTRLGVLR